MSEPVELRVKTHLGWPDYREPSVEEVIEWAMRRELGTQLLDGLTEALEELVVDDE